MTADETLGSDSDRLYVRCHECKKQVGVAQSDPEARAIAEGHDHLDVSWAEEPGGDHAE